MYFVISDSQSGLDTNDPVRHISQVVFIDQSNMLLHRRYGLCTGEFFCQCLCKESIRFAKMKSCCFAYVSYLIQLLFGDCFRIGSANSIKFFLRFSHADNRLFQYPVPSRCYLHYRGLFSPCSPQNPVQNSFPPLNRAKQGIHSKPFYIKAFERLTPEKH